MFFNESDLEKLLTEAEKLSERFGSSSSPDGLYRRPQWPALRSVFRCDRTPADMVSQLRTPSPTLYADLRKCLREPGWARDFVRENGVGTLLDTLRSLQGKSLGDIQLKVDCALCLRLVMDSRVGLDYIMENADYTHKLATALDTEDIPVKKQVFELLSALCVYKPDGYKRALETLEHFKSLKKHRYRFQLIVDEMRRSEVVDYTIALMAFVNCLIISPTALNNRVRIRNEFLGLKILQVLNEFRKLCKESANSDLAVQLDVFDEQRSTDESQFSGPDGVDLSSHMDVFYAILRQIAETPQELPFLSILQHLLRTDINQSFSEIVWETAETLVHRATLLETQQEADRLLRASNLGGQPRCHCSCHYKQNTADVTENNHTPARKNRPTQLPFCSSDGLRTPTLVLSPSQQNPPPTPYDVCSSPGDSSPKIQASCRANLFKQNSVGSSPLNSQSYINGEEVHEKVINQNSSFASRDETDKLNVLTSGNNYLYDRNVRNCENSAIGTTNGPPPPPPPPPPSAVLPPPPPPPPPPPSNFVRVTSEVKKDSIAICATLPQQMTPKPKTKMKSLNWCKIPSSKVIGKDNLWSRVAKEHGQSPNDLDFEIMERLFCQQPTASTNGHISPKMGDVAESADKKKRETQEINLLDGKRSLNINIFLKQFRSSNESIVRILQEGAHEDLGAERLRGLLKILPEIDEVELLKNFDGDKSKLGNAEKFLLHLLDVPSYKLRIESMLLKEEFLGNQEYLENSVETIKCAIQELHECKRLHEILYMVLVAGNFLNAGGYAGNAAGFKMLSLLKLTDIRANKPSMTLIHYVAEQALKKRPDLLQFLEEIQNLEEGSKISVEALKTDVSSFCQRVSKISTQVAEAEQDIKSQMQDFIQFAESKVETIQNEINNLDSERQRLADFLCEEVASFKLEDCFKVFYNFCTRFRAALQENERRHQQEKLAEERRKQREQQIAQKRRSLELVTDADPIMDQLLGDIRSGFPERRLGDIYRRSRRGNNDIMDSDEITLKQLKAQQNVLKRHSDPAMLDKCSGNDMGRNRRSIFGNETGSGDIMEFLQNPNLGEFHDSLERISSTRRSERRKRTDLLNGDIQSRERTGSSPPPLGDASTPPIIELEVATKEPDTKQKLRSKINEWMQQNEVEQKQERDLQTKLQQKRQSLGNNDITNLEKDALEKIEEIESGFLNKKVQYNDVFKNLPREETNKFQLTRSAQARQNKNFNQKVMGLLSSTSVDSNKFAKTRLYQSMRDNKTPKEDVKTISNDDITIHRLRKSENTSGERDESNKIQKSQNYLFDSNLQNQTSAYIPEGNFDRFSSTRKTLRRIKLREMRLEAESVNNVKLNGDQEKTFSQLNMNPATEESMSTEVNSPKSRAAQNVHNFINKDDTQEPIARTNMLSDLETNKDASNFCRQRNTSLRTRQSRLARRINSLTTPVVSPEIHEPNAKNDIYLPLSSNILQTPLLCTGSEKPHQEVPTCPNKSENLVSSNAEITNEMTNNETETCINKRNKEEVGAKDNSLQNSKTVHANGQLSHKITVSVETKSKVAIPKSNTSQLNSKASANTKTTKSYKTQTITSIPSVIKTTQNFKVQQNNKPPSTINGKSNDTGTKTNGLSTIKKTTINRNHNFETNDGPTIISNGKSSPSSSISSLSSSVSTNLKLVRNGKHSPNVNPSVSKKVTLKQNGTVKVSNTINSSNRLNPSTILGNLNSSRRLKPEKKPTIKKAFT